VKFSAVKTSYQSLSLKTTFRRNLRLARERQQ